MRVLVREVRRTSFVTRELPVAYIPGTPFTVRLIAKPFFGTAAWGVEDQPPRGWVVSEISDEGIFDPVTGRVKFGYFTEDRARTLTYRVTPPVNAAGEHEFDGISSNDGRNYLITGDRAINGTALQEHHPADRNQENRITLAELTGYAAAWKLGGIGFTPPNPIPLSYLTRAALIWRQGEAYHFVHTNPAPQCWVPNAGSVRSLVTASSTVRSSVLAATPGAPFEVTIAIQPAPGIQTYALEERVPAGWSVSTVSNEGAFDAATGVIRWGLFMDGTARTLRYTLAAPAGVTSIANLRGIASLNGEEQPVDGASQIVAVESSALLRLPHGERRADGAMQLKLTGPAGQVCALESSTDLHAWTEVAEVFLPDGDLDFVDDQTAGAPQRYYRLRVR